MDCVMSLFYIINLLCLFIGEKDSNSATKIQQYVIAAPTTRTTT